MIRQSFSLRQDRYGIDTDRGCVVLDGVDHFLRYQSFQVLQYLLENPNRVITKEEFQAKVWKDIAVTDNALVQCVAEIRRVFKDDARAPGFIKTVPKIGYRLVASAEAPPESVTATKEGITTPQKPTTAPQETARTMPGGPTLQEMQLQEIPPAGEPAPLPEALLSARFRPSLRSLLAIVFLGLLGLSILGRETLRRRAASQRAMQPAETRLTKTVVVQPFRNNTGSADLNWLRDAFPEMLVDSINHVPQLAASVAGKHPGVLENRVATGKDAPATVITGDISRVGDALLLVFLTKDQNNRVLATDRATVARNELPLEANLFASEIAGRLSVVATESTPALDDVKTTNAEAFRYYRVGVEKARQFETAQAVEALTKAVSLDPGFAMAYARLGYAYAVTNFASEKGQPYLDKAWALSGRLPEKQRLYVAAWRAISKHQFQEATDLLHTLTGRFPEDAEAYVQLANLQRAEELPQQAEETLQAGLHYSPQSKYLYNTLAVTELTMHQYQKAMVAARRYVDLAPDDPNARDTMGMVYQQSGSPYRAIAEYSAALLLEPEFEAATVHLGDAYYQAHRPTEAEEYYKRYISIVNTDAARAIGYGDLATVYQDSGDWEEAKWAATEEHRYNPQAVWNLLVIAVKGKQDQEARRLEKQLAKGVPSQERGTPGDQRTLAYERGWLALQRGNKEAAIASFQEALRHLPPTSGIHLNDDGLSLANGSHPQQPVKSAVPRAPSVPPFHAG